MIARPHDGLALRQFARWYDRTMVSRLSGHASTVRSQPTGDTGGGGRRVADRLGVAVVRPQEHTSTMNARPHDGLALRPFAQARWCDRSTP
eukprot:5509512-Prymnesium_polylepis.1